MVPFRTCLKNIQPYVPGKPIQSVQEETGLSEIIKLASNENPYGCSPRAKDAIRDALDNVFLYPDGYCTDLRKSLAAKTGLDINQFIFGCGTDEIIFMLGKAFIDEADECITADVTFSEYAAAVESMGGVVIYAPLRNYTFDLDRIIKSITPRTKLIFLANPNNPTGTMFTHKDQLDFIRQVPPHIMVVFDEAYGEFADPGKMPNTLALLKDFENVIILKTFSKAYGLASMRVGYGMAQPDVINILERIRPPFNVSTLAQAAAIAALEDENFIKETIAGNNEAKEYMYQELKNMGLMYVPTETNFMLIDTKTNCMHVFQSLMDRGYIIRPCSPFGMETFIRVSLGTRTQMEGFTEALKDVL